MAADRPLRIALFHDVDGWALHNVARNVARVADDGHRVTPVAHAEWFARPGRAAAIARAHDVLVFLWRFHLPHFLDALRRSEREVMAGPDRPAVATVIYDHLWHAPADLLRHGDPFAPSDAVAAASGTLERLYAAAPHLPAPAHRLPDGVDLAAFPVAPPNPDGPLRVGWAGNSAWHADLGDPKGLHSILRPAVERLRREGRAVELVLADAATAPRPRAQMPAFFRDVDVLVCASATEGTPNPVLEAMATGRAVVSTDVGIVRDMAGPLGRAMIVPRSVDAMAAALGRLEADRALLRAMGAENAARRDGLSWESRWPLWRRFLADARAGRDRGERIAAFHARPRRAAEHVRRLVATDPAAAALFRGASAALPGVLDRVRRATGRGR